MSQQTPLETRGEGTKSIISDLAAPQIHEEIAHLRLSDTGVTAKIREQVGMLKSESLDDSLEALCDVEMYFWPGYPQDVTGIVLPLRKSVGEWEVETIMSNRRFLKVYDELSRLPKAAAAERLSRQIESSLETYKSLFAQYVEEHPYLFKLDAKPEGLTFKISNNPEHSPTLMGARFRVLALTLAAGSLRLEQSCQAVLSVAQEAISQRERFYREDEINEWARYLMLSHAGLYNRQILGTALLGTCMDPAKAQQLREEGDLPWKTKTLTHYDADLTPYDLPVRTSPSDADYSGGELIVPCLEPLSDSDFDKIVTALGGILAR